MPSFISASAQRRLVNTAFHSFALANERSSRGRAALKQTQCYPHVVYDKRHPRSCAMDIYLPKGVAGPLPILIYIHGGGFTTCSKETHRGIARGYAQRGFLVFNLEYRSAPQHRFPAALEDVCHAYAWVVKHAVTFGGDLSRLIVSGESAGGNLTAGLLIANVLKRPEPFMQKVWESGVVPIAFMPICALLQVSQPQRFATMANYPRFGLGTARRVARAYLGSGWEDAQDTFLLADPIRLLEQASHTDRPIPPVFSAVGTADILLHDTQRLQQALEHLGAPHDIHFFDNEIHAFHVLYWRKHAKAFWQAQRAFIGKVLSEATEPQTGSA